MLILVGLTLLKFILIGFGVSVLELLGVLALSSLLWIFLYFILYYIDVRYTTITQQPNPPYINKNNHKNTQRSRYISNNPPKTITIIISSNNISTLFQ